MNKRLLLTMLMVFSVLLSVSAVCASEITVTDSYADGSDVSVSSDLNVGNDSSKLSLSSEKVLESENSNILSTNTDSDTLAEGAVSTKIIAPDRTVNIGDAINGYDYQVILRDANGNGLAGKEVSFDFNGKTSTGITDSKGWATAKLTADTSGTYDVEVTFDGDADYAKVSQIGTIKIIKNEVNFVAPDRTLYLDEISSGYTYPVILRDSEGNPLSKKEVTLIFNGKKLTETTNNRGYCYFNITADKAGSYGVTLRFAGDQYYYGKSCSNFKTVEVIVKKNVTFIAPDRTLHVEDIESGYTYPVLLRDSDGKALANKKITLTFNGKKLTGTTNSRGYCYFNLTVNRANSYPITLNFAGDKYYYANSALHFKTVNVIKWNVTFDAQDIYVYLDEISGGYSYPVLLTDSKGKALPNKKITLTFNGKTLEGVTDSDGYCYFNLTADEEGLYKVSLKFAGDRYCYSKFANNFKTVEVIVMKNVTFIAPDRTLHVEDIYSGYTYPVLLRDSDGKALANKQITLIFNGKNLIGTTNSKGYCYFNINVDDAGTYDVGLVFEGDKYYYAKTAFNFRTINVIKWDVNFDASDYILYVRELAAGYIYSVLLMDSEGNPLANKQVTLIFNGREQSATTYDDGYCYFEITADYEGTFGVSLEFEGDTFYNSKWAPEFRTIWTIKEAVKLYWMSDTYFVTGSEYFVLLLTDENGFGLANRVLKLNIDSAPYYATTDSNGYAVFMNLHLSPKSYWISYSYDGDDWYNSYIGGIDVVIARNGLEGYGYFVFGRDMKNIDLNLVASFGTTDLFLNYYAFTVHGKSAVESWIANANRVGIRVHIWMQVYYDGEWHNPIDTKFSNERIEEAKGYARVKGVSGILFDYLRYPGTAYKTSGGTEAVSRFTKQVTEEIHKINPNIIVSAALMPETTSSVYYYGQDYSALSTYLDAVLPMIYKGNYGKGSSWIGSTTKWYVENSRGAAVWTTLQSYRSDDNPSPLPIDELNYDAKVASNAGASGVVSFRFGLSHVINFNDL